MITVGYGCSPPGPALLRGGRRRAELHPCRRAAASVPPALSKQIRGLETALRAQLFRRDRRQVQLTAAGTVLYTVARRLLDDWDDGVAAVADAAAQEARLLRVGILTSIGRELYPGVIEHFAKRQPGWHVELRSVGWGDPTAGLSDQATDVAFVWLPVDGADVEFEVLASERRFVAISSRHPLAGRQAVEFAEIAGEPFAALPVSAGRRRASSGWPPARRAGTPARVAAEVASADEVFEIVSSGAAVTLLAEGNAVVYSRPGITCIPVVNLEPAQLAVAWRRPTAGSPSGTSSAHAATQPTRLRTVRRASLFARCACSCPLRVPSRRRTMTCAAACGKCSRSGRVRGSAQRRGDGPVTEGERAAAGDPPAAHRADRGRPAAAHLPRAWLRRAVRRAGPAAGRPGRRPAHPRAAAGRTATSSCCPSRWRKT